MKTEDEFGPLIRPGTPGPSTMVSASRNWIVKDESGVCHYRPERHPEYLDVSREGKVRLLADARRLFPEKTLALYWYEIQTYREDEA